MANWKDIEAREAVRKEYEQGLREKLEGLGVQFRIAHFTGDSSYPTEYTLSIGDISAVGPTFDLALVEFIERLLKQLQLAQLSRLELQLKVTEAEVEAEHGS